MTDPSKRYERFVELSREITHLGSASALLDADRATAMPKGGSAARAETLGYLAGLAHEKSVSAEYADLLRELVQDADAGSLPAERATIVRDSYEDYLDAVKLPTEFVEEQTNANSVSEQAWDAAKNGGDWNAFLPHFTEVVRLARQQCALRKSCSFASPYEIVLDDYEPGMTAARLDALFGPLKARLIGLVGRIAAASPQQSPDQLWQRNAAMPVPDQQRMCREIAATLGFDFTGGRLATSTHPFSVRTHPGDIWITAKYIESDFTDALGSVMHEAGHAMYEQALPLEHYGTTGGEAPSYGIHESQSRLWERAVGKSQAFCAWFCKRYGMHGHTYRMYRSINRVQPSLIRIEADEVTYALHIILRYEIERALINGTLEPSDAPELWVAKMRESFGIVPTGYADGIFQDGHWPSGAFGYFPSYTLGDIYADALFSAAEREIPNLEAGFADGKFADLREWLRQKVHRIGGLQDAASIVEAAAGAPVTPETMLTRFERKYGELYDI